MSLKNLGPFQFSAYCFNTNFALPDKASQTLDLDYNIQGQIARISCDLGYEYTDQVAKDADSNFNPGDDFLMKTRTKHCVEEFVGNGGTWQDDHVIPDSCYGTFHHIRTMESRFNDTSRQ